MKLIREDSGFLLRKRRLLKFRKELLGRKTPAEIAFEKILNELKVEYKDLQIEYRAQRVLAGANAITDYYIPYLRMCFEVDGEYHEFTQDYDKRRTKRIRKLNCGIARFKNWQVLNDPEGVKKKIVAHFNRKDNAIKRKQQENNNKNWYDNPLNVSKTLRFPHRFNTKHNFKKLKHKVENRIKKSNPQTTV